MRNEAPPDNNAELKIRKPAITPVPADVTVEKSRGRFLVSSSDPITGATDRIGWHAVNVSANDVATSGIMPDALIAVGFFQEGILPSDISSTMEDVNRTAEQLGIAVLGTRILRTPSVKKPVLTVTAFGTGDDFVTSSGARKGDSILISKTAGIEGTSILSRLPSIERLVDRETRLRGKGLIDKLSILKEADIAFKTGKVHAMHDLTEGGVVGCTLEISLASKLGFELYSDRVPLDESTKTICSKIHIDPLKLIGSGSLLITCNPDDSKAVIGELSRGLIPCVEIGKLHELSFGRWIDIEGKRMKLTDLSVQDELWVALGKYGDLS